MAACAASAAAFAPQRPAFAPKTVLAAEGKYDDQLWDMDAKITHWLDDDARLVLAYQRTDIDDAVEMIVHEGATLQQVAIANPCSTK